jgi:hypothetical protein
MVVSYSIHSQIFVAFDFLHQLRQFCLIKKIKVIKIKYIHKLHYVINHIMIKIHNNYKFYFE